MRQHWPLIPTLLQRKPWLFLFLLLPLTAAVLLARHVGDAAPLWLTYLEAPDCPQPCWLGMRPGYLSRQEVLAIASDSFLTAPGSLDAQLEVEDTDRRYILWETRYFPSYDVQAYFRSDRLMRLELFVDGQVLLGDVLAVFGEPSHAMLCPHIATGFNYRDAVSAALYFFGGAVEVWASTPNSADWQVRSDMLVQQITYRTAPTDSESWVPLGTTPWHGFGRTQYGDHCR